MRVMSPSCEDPQENLAREESLLREVQDGDEATLGFYVNRPCIVMGRNNREEEWVHGDAVRDAKIPLLRRVSGGGTVYHDAETLNYGIVTGRRRYEELKPAGMHIVDYFRKAVAEALAPAGIVLEPAGKSDLNLNGRKVGGCAAAMRSNGILFHGTLLFAVDYDAYERFLPIPPNRDASLAHREFVTSFAQEGMKLSMEDVKRELGEGLRE